MKLVEKKIFLDKTKVSHIVVEPLRPLTLNYTYKPAKLVKFLGVTLMDFSEGYYYGGDYDAYLGSITIGEVEKNKDEWIVIDGVIHELPKLKVYVGSKLIYNKYFNSETEVIKYITQHYEKVNYKIL